MKKLLFVFIFALALSFSINAMAEMSNQTMSGNVYTDQQVFVMMENNSGASVTSNSVVVLDVTATAGTTLGSYFTTATTAGNSYICGVTDETIADGAIGRVCVRGPHRLQFTTAPTTADRVSNGTTAGKATAQTSTANKYGYVGTALLATTTTDSYYGTDIWWVWVSPTIQ